MLTKIQNKYWFYLLQQIYMYYHFYYHCDFTEKMFIIFNSRRVITIDLNTTLTLSSLGLRSSIQKWDLIKLHINSEKMNILTNYEKVFFSRYFLCTNVVYFNNSPILDSLNDKILNILIFGVFYVCLSRMRNYLF